MSVQRKPRAIGPVATPAEAPPAAESAEASFSMEDFLGDLSAGELMDLDEASGGAIARMSSGADEPVTLRLLFAVAWVARRREQPRLTFAQVRQMRPEALAAVLNALGESGLPKANSAPGSSPTPGRS